MSSRGAVCCCFSPIPSLDGQLAPLSPGIGRVGHGENAPSALPSPHLANLVRKAVMLVHGASLLARPLCGRFDAGCLVSQGCRDTKQTAS